MRRRQGARLRLTAVAAACLGAVIWPVSLCQAQAPVRSTSLTVPGQTGQARVTQIGGRNFVDLESLARLLGASLRFQGTRIILTPGGEAAGATTARPTAQQEPQGLSREFVTSAITTVNAIREWHAALATLIGQQLPVTADLLGPYRRHAEGDAALAMAAARTPQDRAASSVLQTLVANMGNLNTTYISNHDTVTNIRTDALAGDALNTTVVACISTMAAMQPGGDAPGACR